MATEEEPSIVYDTLEPLLDCDFVDALPSADIVLDEDADASPTQNENKKKKKKKKTKKADPAIETANPIEDDELTFLNKKSELNSQRLNDMVSTVFRSEIVATDSDNSPEEMYEGEVNYFSLDVNGSKLQEEAGAGLVNPVLVSEEARELVNPAVIPEDVVKVAEDPPWSRVQNTIRSPLLLLHQEIANFCQFVSPTPEEQAARLAAVERVSEVIKFIWPHCQVKVFGSFETGLYLPSSDIDVVILHSDVRIPQNGLQALAKALSQKSVAHKIQVIGKARVPIVKFIEKESDVAFDISFDVDPDVHSTVRGTITDSSGYRNNIIALLSDGLYTKAEVNLCPELEMDHSKEPSTAPDPEKWYPFTLGSSLNDQSSTKFCSLRYEFKPASIDTTRPGSLHKSKENKVTVEFNNNQPGRPKVSFQGSSEDYKESDAVLFFDGQTFRLERLHKAVIRLRHVRLPGESASATAGTGLGGAAAEARSPPGSGIARANKGASIKTTAFSSLPVAVERIDIGEPDSPSPAGKKNGKRSADDMMTSSPIPTSPDQRSIDEDEHVDVDDEEDMAQAKTERLNDAQEANANIDEYVTNEHDSDDEIADVDFSGDEADKGPNAAEALRAQVVAQQIEKQQTSSSSGTSGSGSSGSGSGSGSSSSDSEGSDDDSASSGGDS